MLLLFSLMLQIKATFNKQENKKMLLCIVQCVNTYTTALLYIYIYIYKALALLSSLNMFHVQYIELPYIYL